jgi:uridylate kinase
MAPRMQRVYSVSMSKNETIVISVGGSLIVPDQIDVTFLKRFKKFILEQTNQGKRFAIITGGGKTARRYQDAASTVSTLTPDDLDWLGLHATRLNGHLLRTIFRDIAYPVIITNPDEVLDVPKRAKLIVAAGYRPGASTDLRAVQIAHHLGAKRLINLSNIDYAYDKDPSTHKDAKPIKTSDWATFRALLPDHWDPGLSSPFDPIAAREAQKVGMEVAIINGSQLAQVTRYLDNKSFAGTRIA